MQAPFPRLDRRRQSHLRKELLAIARTMLPDWEEVGSEQGFGRALMEIAAHLAEKVTQRIDQTPRRDAVAFYAMLDVPADAARPSVAPVIFQLGDNLRNPVTAAERTRLAAEGEDEEIFFETMSSLKITPARPLRLFAVDGKADRIELSPEKFFEIPEEVPPAIAFKTSTFAGAGATRLQIEPMEGLEEKDLLRIEGQVYRVLNPDDGGLVVLENALAVDVPRGRDIEKVTRLDALSMKNDQAHRLYVGHSEVLNLEEAATIKLTVDPPEATELLVSERVVWELFGINESIPEVEDPDWHTLTAKETSRGVIEITKDWRGTVEETGDEGEPGAKSRWLRATYLEQIDEQPLFGARIRTIRLGVTSQGPQPSEGSRTIDQAYHNITPLPLTTPFQPFGPEPQLSDTFAFSAPEAFSKAGATVTLNITSNIKKPGERNRRIAALKVDDQTTELSWEYFDGDSWRRLEPKGMHGFQDGTANLMKSDKIEFKVPEDLTETAIAGKTGLWVRARVIGGNYGQSLYIVDSTPIKELTRQTVKVDRSGLTPPEIVSIEVTFKVEPQPAEQIRTVNNLTTLDRSEASKDEHAEFPAFEGALSVNEGSQRVLYLGFDRSFELPSLSIFVDAEDQEGKEIDLLYEVWSGGRWLEVSAEDKTGGFHRSGFVILGINVATDPRRLFGQESARWLRIRPSVQDDVWAPRLRGFWINAVTVQQARTIEQEVLGSSMGEPGQSFKLVHAPVLHDSLELRVREELGEEEKQRLVAEDEDQVKSFNDDSIAGDWVLWKQVDSFIGHGPEDRVYQLEPRSGKVTFGEGTRMPPPGADGIRAVLYQTGGGDEGNVAAYAIRGLKSAVESVEGVANPVAAAGGTDAPELDAQLEGAPSRVRRRLRVISPRDIEALVESFSPRIVRARCLFPSGPGEPVRISLLQSDGDERCPKVSLEDRLGYAKRIREQAWGGLSSDDIRVETPVYKQVTLTLKLRPRSGDVAAALQQAAQEKLLGLFHSVKGGPQGRGWPFGLEPVESDVLRVLSELEDLDRIESVDLQAPRLRDLEVACAEGENIKIELDLEGLGD